MPKQHTKPCNECPFRRIAPKGWLGSNIPQHFAVNANRECHFPRHKTMGKPQEFQCAGRATMWANQCKVSRDGSVPHVAKDKETVFSHIGEFIKHHGIEITPMQLMGAEPLDDMPTFDDDFEEDDYEEEYAL